MKKSLLRRKIGGAKTHAPDRPAFIMAAMLVICGFLMVGGARDDLLSLLIWRPLSALLFVLTVTLYGKEAWQKGRSLLVFALAVVGLIALHLVPLPPSIWTSLPGHDVVENVYRSAGMELPWQPLSVAQARTWNALFSLLGPLAVLIVALALDRNRHKQLLVLLIGLGFVSGIVGMIQAIGPSNGLLYFYRITNAGTSVGIFANRNHQAVMLATLFPLLAAYISLFKGRPDRLIFYRSITLAGAALLVPLILMTGSRLGLVLMVLGMAFAWWIYQPPVATGRVVGIRNEHRSRLIGIGIAVILLAIVLIVAFRTPALERLVNTDSASELRVQALPVLIEATGKFLPFGSGIGTFVETYQLFEPDALVSASYFNHAHNDFAELLLTGGLPAAILLAWAGLLIALGFWNLARQRTAGPDDPGFSTQVMGRAGLSVIIMLALASATDYPLRVPSLMLYGVIAAVWSSNAYRFARK